MIISYNPPLRNASRCRIGSSASMLTSPEFLNQTKYLPRLNHYLLDQAVTKDKYRYSYLQDVNERALCPCLCVHHVWQRMAVFIFFFWFSVRWCQSFLFIISYLYCSDTMPQFYFFFIWFFSVNFVQRKLLLIFIHFTNILHRCYFTYGPFVFNPYRSREEVSVTNHTAPCLL